MVDARSCCCVPSDHVHGAISITTWLTRKAEQKHCNASSTGLSERGCVVSWQVGPWCVLLPEGTRICHLRTNMGLDWGQNVLPVLPDLGALPTDILVSNAAICSRRRSPSRPGFA